MNDYIIYKVNECCWGIGQPKRDYQKLLIVMVSSEGSLMDVL